MFTDESLQPIYDDMSYVASDGTKYPSNWDKRTISGLQKVTLADPVGPSLIVTGFTIQDINGILTQVFQTAPAPSPVIPIPDLATQLAKALIAKGTISESDIDAKTLADINTKLEASNK